jgi:hypothetical protein
VKLDLTDEMTDEMVVNLESTIEDQYHAVEDYHLEKDEEV